MNIIKLIRQEIKEKQFRLQLNLKSRGSWEKHLAEAEMDSTQEKLIIKELDELHDRIQQLIRSIRNDERTLDRLLAEKKEEPVQKKRKQSVVPKEVVELDVTKHPSQFKPAHLGSIPPPPVLRRCVGGRVTCAASSMTTSELKAALKAAGVGWDGCIEKSDLVRRLVQTKYDMSVDV